MESLASIEWTYVLVALVGSGGLLVALVQRVGSKRKPKISAVEETQAFTTAEAESGLNREGMNIALEAIRQASKSMSQTEQVNIRLEAAEDQIRKQREELKRFRRSYKALFEWAHDLIANWHIVRLREDPPELPEDLHRP